MEELRVCVEAFQRGERTIHLPGHVFPTEILEDVAVIEDMLIPLACSRNADGHIVNWCTCRHLTEGGNCGIYQTRPNMCRTYPGAAQCELPECTLYPGTCTSGPSDGVTIAKSLWSKEGAHGSL